MNSTSAEGRVAFLTGCASGIGRHLVGAFSSRGYRVFATDVNDHALTEARSIERWDHVLVRTAALDVRSAQQWERAFDQCESTWRTPDVALNIAGVIKPGSIVSCSDADMDLHVDVNLKGTILGTRSAAQRMVNAGAGHIINFGSLAGLAAIPGLALYSASKFAVRGFSLATALELRPHNIFLTVVLPDAVQTPMLDLQIDYEEAAMTFTGARPLTVEQIAASIFERVLPNRPLEIALPLGRALLARVASAVPEIAMALQPALVKKGHAAQRRAREKRERSNRT